jgi:UPF0288 family protein (methanogenesis marker protein 3)
MLCLLIILDKDDVVRFHSLWHVKTSLVLEQQLSKITFEAAFQFLLHFLNSSGRKKEMEIFQSSTTLSGFDPSNKHLIVDKNPSTCFFLVGK